jgi:tetratricopeptide (TPR) repeat protein
MLLRENARRGGLAFVGQACAIAALVAHAAEARQTPQRPREAESRVAAGTAALHNFEYEDAAEAFREAQQLAPGFVRAYWGEAMTCDQALWRLEDVRAARAVLARLAPTPSARAAKAADPEERGLLAAVEVLFGEGDTVSRHARYTSAMSALAAAYPSDHDVTSLYALALLASKSRGLIAAAGTHDAHDRQLAGSDIQRQVAEILQGVLASDPRHPGALHYLLHDYDDPEHAPLALDAARTYGTVANGSSHALHMPAHIFLQVGRWHDAAASDRAAFDASVARAERKHLDRALRNYHALGWLQYELLQLGRYREAQDLIREIEEAVNAVAPRDSAPGAQPLVSNRSSMRARFVIETRRWDLMANERTFGNADELLAIGMSAAARSNFDLAERARQALAARVNAPQEGDLRPAIAVMEREVAGMMALAQGRRDEALSALAQASSAESALPAPFGLPSPPKPAQELFGELLLDSGRPRDAVEQFERALQRNRNRSLSVLGLARAQAALGDRDKARTQYAALLASFDRADADVPEVAEARSALARLDARPTVPEGSKVLVYGATAASVTLAAAVFYAMSRRRRLREDAARRRPAASRRTRKTRGRR